MEGAMKQPREGTFVRTPGIQPPKFCAYFQRSNFSLCCFSVRAFHFYAQHLLFVFLGFILFFHDYLLNLDILLIIFSFTIS